MPEWIRLLLAGLATYRVAQLVALDEGPFGVFLHLRTLAGTYDRGPNGQPTGAWGRLFGCPYCVGLYAAVLAGAAYLYPTTIGDLLLIWLGLAGLAAYLQGPRMAG